MLVIVRILEPRRVRSLVQAARDLGLAALVEVHSRGELDIAVSSGASLIGINSRDLDSFTIDRDAADRLLAQVPADIVAVAESAMSDRSDVERAAAAGADHVLVGTAVARLDDPRAAVRGLVGVRRNPRGSGR